MNTRQILGFVFFAAYLFISVIDIMFYFRAGALTTIEQIAALLDISAKLNFASKILVVCMFGLVFIPGEEKEKQTSLQTE